MLALVEDKWLGTVLGKKVYTVARDIENLDIDAGNLGNCLLQTRISFGDISAISHVLGLGFDIIVSNVTLSADRKRFITWNQIKSNDGVCVVRAVKKDQHEIQAIAGSAFKFDRFHVDKNIKDETANRIKEEWATHFFRKKRGDFMLVAKRKSEILGFVLVIESGADATIDLIAVKSEVVGMGIGRKLLCAVMRELPVSVNRIIVGTQLSNKPSLKLYTSAGFMAQSGSFSAHLHIG